jgi:hypothetical protein
VKDATVMFRNDVSVNGPIAVARRRERNMA